MASAPLYTVVDSGSYNTRYIPGLSNTYSNAASNPNFDVPVMHFGQPKVDPLRTYRACLHCRSRKSKCVLDLNNGRPPCRRCQREARKCILGETHRGGRRVRRKHELKGGNPSSSPAVSQSPTRTAQSEIETTQPPTFITSQEMLQTPELPWCTDIFERTTSSDNISQQAGYQNIASADLQNPSDALEILTQVADREDKRESLDGENNANQWKMPIGAFNLQPRMCLPKIDDQRLHYKPVQDKKMSLETVYDLFSSYEALFHPYFPIIPCETFDQTRLPWLSRHEPHLFSAILTIASKNDEIVHQICYDHMQHLITLILEGSDANVEAVEAMLLLSQWVSHRPQAGIAVGRGEEDRVAWMYTGTALRLGYFLGIDRTSFKDDHDGDVATFNRKRVAWAACYICDRQVSIRLGRGFWSRGPGPLSGLKSEDFPTLQPRSPNEDNWALIFQANLELTQIFNNVHDMLYSLKGHAWMEMLEGRYVKYLDDFRASIRGWHEVWGTLICSPHLKASLLLTYDYLRLYVNAFAYQATISRTLIGNVDSPPYTGPLPLIEASACDARFIYEAVDAAKSILSTVKTSIDPEHLRYMPSSCFLFIIYSAVFLYKTSSTTTMTDEDWIVLCGLVNETIGRLQKASAGANHMGSRYARLLDLLWRKAPMYTNHWKGPLPNCTDSPFDQLYTGPLPNVNAYQENIGNFEFTPGGTFNWLDLDATWNFATQNCSIGANLADTETMEGGVTFTDAKEMVTDYLRLVRDGPNLML